MQLQIDKFVYPVKCKVKWLDIHTKKLTSIVWKKHCDSVSDKMLIVITALWLLFFNYISDQFL